MTDWHDYLRTNETVPEWPYPVRYDIEPEQEIEVDVLVIGGGGAGRLAAGAHSTADLARRRCRDVIALQ